MADFTIQTTADWLAGLNANTSTDSDNLLHFGLLASMNAAPTCFTPKTAGGVSWAYLLGTVFVNETLSSHAAVFVSANPISVTTPFIATCRMMITQPLSVQFTPTTIGLFQNATQPSPTTDSTINLMGRVKHTQTRFDSGVKFYYRTTGDMAMYWNGTTNAWSNSFVNAYIGAMGTYYIYKLISDGTNLRWRLENTSGTLIEESTTTVPISAIKNDTNPFWLMLGDAYTNTEYGSMTVDYITVGFGSGSWTSPQQLVTPYYKLGNLVIYHAGLSASAYISRIEILRASDNVILSTYTGSIISGASSILTAGEFDNGLDSTVSIGIKVKVYYTSDSITMPVISKIEGSYIPFSVEALSCYAAPDQTEYYEDGADLDISQVRSDYQFIWGKNLMQTELIREKNPQAGDYFHEDEAEVELRTQIWMNIQGISSDAYKRIEQGLITPEAKLHAYVTWDTCVQNLDVIKIGKYLYRIENHNKSMYGGQTAFQEFDLLRIDHVSSTLGGGCNG